MNSNRTRKQEAAQDIFFGQSVINWARWFVIAAAAVMVLDSNTTSQMVVGVLPVLGLIVANFYLHGRRLAERPANPAMIVLASLMDVAFITWLVLAWPGGRGLASEFYILYYPVVLAFAFVMPPRVTAIYTVVAVAAYAAVASLADPTVFFVDGNIGADLYVPAVKALAVRVITIGAVGGLGAFYYRKQRDRRHQTAREATVASPLVQAS